MTADVEERIPYEVRALPKTATKPEAEKYVVWSEKGIPLQSPSGKIFILSVDDDGALTTQEVTE